MTPYYLDTNICVYIMNGKYPHLQQRLLRYATGQVKLPAMVLFELYYGAEKSQKRVGNIAKIREFMEDIEIAPFDARAAEVAGKIRADLEREGRVIGGNDILIAATAIAHGATLVTNNTREFARVSGIVLENWVEG